MSMPSSPRVALWCALGSASVGLAVLSAPAVAGAGTVSYARMVDGSPACVSVKSRQGRPRSAEFIVPRGGGASDWVATQLVRRQVAGSTWWVSTEPPRRLGVQLHGRKAHVFWGGKVKGAVVLPKIPATRVEEMCPSP